MGGNRRLWAAVIAAALVGSLIPATPTAATSDGCGSSGCEFTRDVAGDYWAGEIDVLEEATVASGSTIEVTLDFDNRTDRSGFLLTIEDLEDGGLPLGIVVWVKATRDEVRVTHTPIAGDPVSVSASPVGELAWDQISATIQWNVDQDFDAHTHRLVATGPTADALSVDTQLDSDESMRLGAESEGATGGALVSESAWDPATMVDLPGVKVLREGAYAFEVPQDERLYGYHGPATGGAAAVDACFGIGGYCGVVAGVPGANWGHSVFGVERPDGTSEQREFTWPACTGITCPGGPANSVSFSFVDDASGPWTLTVAEHEGLGPAPNMLGLVAPIELP